MITFSCPECGRSFQAPEEQSGENGKCPHCGGPIQVPPTAPDPLLTAPYLPPAEAPTLAPGGPSPEVPAGAAVAIPGYEVLGELGRGGMGVIYKARQECPRRLVALKMVLAGEYAGAEALARFRTEAEAVARLNHPNIVRIHEVGEHQGRPFLTLEFVEGGSLAQKLSGKPLRFGETAVLLHQLAQAVHAAHQRGIIHRDLKPANVLLAPDEDNGPDALGVPKIADFGLAKQIAGMVSVALTGPRTQSGAIMGTPAYMAPEQAGGKGLEIGPAANIYALGAIFYECLTGRPPFQAETLIDTVMQVVSREPVPPLRLRPKCPRDLETICLKGLEKDPKKRYATAGALADDLRRYLEDKPIACRPPNRLERWGRTLRKRKELLYLTAGAVAAVGVSLVVLALWNPGKKEAKASAQAAQAADERALPADLDLVPRDAFAFATVRVADLWARQDVKELGSALTAGQFPVNKTELEHLRELQNDTGLNPADIERATYVMLRQTDRKGVVVLLALTKPCDVARVYAAVARQTPMGPPQQIEGKTVYRPVREGMGAPAFCPFTNRLLLLGSTGALRTVLEQQGRRPSQGPLSGALALAAGNDPLVIGVHPPPRFFEGVKDFLSDKQRLAFQEMESAMLALHLPAPAADNEPLTSFQGEAFLTFPDDVRAKQGQAAARMAQKDLLRILDEPRTGPSPINRWVGPLLEPLRNADWQQEGRLLRLTVNVQWEARDVEQLQAAARQRAVRDHSLNNLRQISMALRNYQNVYGHFPPAVVYGAGNRPLYSWRVLILPFIEQTALYKEFKHDEAWDSPHNKKLLAKMPDIYAAPWRGKELGLNVRTYYQAVVGPGAAFEGRQGLRPADFIDGASNTLIIVEAAQAVPWFQPGRSVLRPPQAAASDGRPLPGRFSRRLRRRRRPLPLREHPGEISPRLHHPQRR